MLCKALLNLSILISYSHLHQIQHGFNAGGDHHGTPHLHRAVSRGCDDIIKVLVHSGAEVTAENELTGKTSMHVAAASSNVTSCEDILEFLIAMSRDNVFSSNGDGGKIRRPFEYRKRDVGLTGGCLYKESGFLNQNLDLAKFTRGDDPSTSWRSNIKIREISVDNHDALQTDNNNNGASSCMNGQQKRDHSCKVLNFNPLETADRVQGNTALHVACAYNNEAAVLCLLRHGANPNPLNYHGDTPLAKLLQPVTRRADDCHNRSRLALARRLVALGLVVEKKGRSGFAVDEDNMPGVNEITCSPRSGRVTSGSGSAKVTNGLENGRANMTDKSVKDAESIKDDSSGGFELDLFFDEAKSKNADFGVKSIRDYTNTLGVSYGKEQNIICGELTGLHGYAASGVSDKCSSVREKNGCRRGVGSACVLKVPYPKLKSQEEIEAQLEALCEFQASEPSEPVSPSLLCETENVSQDTRCTENSLQLNERAIGQNASLSSNLPKVSKLRNTSLRLERLKIADTSQDKPKKNIQRADAAGVGANEYRRRIQSDVTPQAEAANKSSNDDRKDMPSFKTNKHSATNPKVARYLLGQGQVPVKDKNSRISTHTNSKPADALVHQKEQNSNPCTGSQKDHLLTSANSQHKGSNFGMHVLTSEGVKTASFQNKETGRRRQSARGMLKSPVCLGQQIGVSSTEHEAAAAPRSGRSHSSSHMIETHISSGRTRHRSSVSTRGLSQEIVSTRAHLQEIQGAPSNSRDNDSVNRAEETARVETPAVQPKKDRFRFPSRDERIRLRFKRLLGELSATLTLQQLCRLAILRSLTGKSVTGSVDKLGLPVLMQNFLLRDDLF